MSLQELLVVLALAAAVAYLAWRGWRAWRGRTAGCGGCGSGCGSEASRGTQTLIPREQLTLRARPRR